MAYRVGIIEVIDDNGSVDWVRIINAPSLGNASGLAVGAVGSYALLWSNDTTAETPGSTVAGSNLRYSNTYTFISGLNTQIIGYGPTAPAGTWRCMGHTSVSGGTAQAISATNVTLWLRIS
jgi:hypothetical protein